MRRFPFHLQHDAMQCGIACLQMVFESYGEKFALAELSSHCNLTTEGVSLLSLSRAAQHYGMHTVCGRVSLYDIKKVPLPCILHWNQNHYVVLYHISIGRKGYIYHVADPGKGKLKLTEAEFAECWISTVSNGEEKGVLMLLEPTPDFGKNREEAKEESRSFGFLFSYLRKYSKYFWVIALGLAAGSMAQLLFPLLMQAVVDVGVNGKDLGFVYLVLIGQLMLVLSSTAVDFVRRWILLHISVRINVSLISDFFGKLFRLPMPFFDTKQTGDILQRMGDHTRVQDFLTGQTLSIIFAFVTFVVFSIVLLSYSVVVFAVFAAFSVAYGLWTSLFLRRRRVLDYEMFGKQAVSQDKTWQMITTMQEIKLQGCSQRRRLEWEDTQADLLAVQMKSLKQQQAEEVGGTLINGVKGVVVTILAAKAVIDGSMTLGMMLSVQYIIGQLASPVSQLMAFIYSLQDVKISLERINEVQTAEDEDNDESLTAVSQSNDRSIDIVNLKFKYNEDDEDYTLDIGNLHMKQSTVTAIVGRSGCGKTTLLKQILGYYLPLREGSTIRIGDVNLESLNREQLRSMCGVVMQDGVIFSESIARNIAVGDGDIDPVRLAESARIACIDDFINDLPLGFNTIIGRNGMGLSMGQKQRILIARAVYKNPGYLFLDEATNSLDANTERSIVRNLNEFFKGRTVIIIAHRLSTVRNADNIVVIDHGRIVEQGSHEELTEKKGAYYKLVKNQLEL